MGLRIKSNVFSPCLKALPLPVLKAQKSPLCGWVIFFIFLYRKRDFLDWMCGVSGLTVAAGKAFPVYFYFESVNRAGAE